MKKQTLVEGDILQLKPEFPRFGGMFIVCTEPKNWGCQGYLISPTEFEATKFKGVAYLRPKFEDMEYCGQAHWMYEHAKDEDEDE